MAIKPQSSFPILSGSVLPGEIIVGKTAYNISPLTKITGTGTIAKRKAGTGYTPGFTSTTLTFNVTGVGFTPSQVYLYGSANGTIEIALLFSTHGNLTSGREFLKSGVNGYTYVVSVFPNSDGFQVTLTSPITITSVSAFDYDCVE